MRCAPHTSAGPPSDRGSGSGHVLVLVARAGVGDGLTQALHSFEIVIVGERMHSRPPDSLAGARASWRACQPAPRPTPRLASPHTPTHPARRSSSSRTAPNDTSRAAGSTPLDDSGHGSRAGRSSATAASHHAETSTGLRGDPGLLVSDRVWLMRTSGVMVVVAGSVVWSVLVIVPVVVVQGVGWPLRASVVAAH